MSAYSLYTKIYTMYRRADEAKIRIQYAKSHEKCFLYNEENA